MPLRLFQLSLLLLVSLLFSHSTCAAFLLEGLYTYIRIFSASFLIKFTSSHVATSINIHIPLSLPHIMMSCLLLQIVLSVCNCWFHNVVTLPIIFVVTDYGTWSYQGSLPNFTPISLHMLKCS
jgi:hypothetical protein